MRYALERIQAVFDHGHLVVFVPANVVGDHMQGASLQDIVDEVIGVKPRAFQRPKDLVLHVVTGVNRDPSCGLNKVDE